MTLSLLGTFANYHYVHVGRRDAVRLFLIGEFEPLSFLTGQFEAWSFLIGQCDAWSFLIGQWDAWSFLIFQFKARSLLIGQFEGWYFLTGQFSLWYTNEIFFFPPGFVGWTFPKTLSYQRTTALCCCCFDLQLQAGMLGLKCGFVQVRATATEIEFNRKSVISLLLKYIPFLHRTILLKRNTHFLLFPTTVLLD